MCAAFVVKFNWISKTPQSSTARRYTCIYVFRLVWLCATTQGNNKSYSICYGRGRSATRDTIFISLISVAVWMRVATPHDSGDATRHTRYGSLQICLWITNIFGGGSSDSFGHAPKHTPKIYTRNPSWCPDFQSKGNRLRANPQQEHTETQSDFENDDCEADNSFFVGLQLRPVRQKAACVLCVCVFVCCNNIQVMRFLYV